MDKDVFIDELISILQAAKGGAEKMRAARWIDRGDEHYCDGCGQMVLYDAECWNTNAWAYCPYCGARMARSFARNRLVEPLTDEEQRIFLSAIRAETEKCKEIDARDPGGVGLERICKEICRKVMASLWG